jgi:hypothetical protein
LRLPKRVALSKFQYSQPQIAAQKDINQASLGVIKEILRTSRVFSQERIILASELTFSTSPNCSRLVW